MSVSSTGKSATRLRINGSVKIISTIDVLSEGRFTWGIGVGWCREEFEAIVAAGLDASMTTEVLVEEILEVDHAVEGGAQDHEGPALADGLERHGQTAILQVVSQFFHCRPILT